MIKVSCMPQLCLFKQWGGKRRGAGRPSKNARAGAKHKTRPELNHRYPLHVVLRVAHELGNLRRKETYEAIQRATVTVVERGDFRIVQASIQRHHVHLIVEAQTKAALAVGMQAFHVSAARRLNAAVSIGAQRRKGCVFTDRYFASSITNPTQARNTLIYCLHNFRHHNEHMNTIAGTWKFDWYSSAPVFGGFCEYDKISDADPQRGLLWAWPAGYTPLFVRQAQTWLLQEGWRRAGSISCAAVPAPHAPGAQR